MIKVDEKKLSILIVNWNGKNLLAKCIGAILAEISGSEWEIIVIDNGSDDDSVALIENHFPEVVLIKNDTNIGFARAVNKGIEISAGDFILLLNNDAIITPESLDRLVDIMISEPAVGIAGPRTYFPDGTLQVSWARFTHLSSALLGSRQPLKSAFKFIRHAGNSHLPAYDNVDFVSGAVMLIRSALFSKIGLFDETFFMYAEDMDFCLKAKKAGWKVAYVPAATAVHGQGKSTKWDMTETIARQLTNTRRVYLHHFGRLRTGLFFSLFFIGTVIRVFYYRVKVILRGSEENLKKSRLQSITLRLLWSGTGIENKLDSVR